MHRCQSISLIFENGIPNKKAVYRRKLVRLPQPQFIAPGRFPDLKALRLSGSFMASSRVR
ncbi:MAG: hypothetical protein FWB78_08655 [Treponema sp.]|nr:hypothetical protein [Treponema sp.]